jgi:hypothetical protein
MPLCQFCSKGFEHSRGLKLHEPYCEQNPNRLTAKCKQCGREFANPQAVSAHTRHAHRPSNKITLPKAKRKTTKPGPKPGFEQSANGVPTLTFCPCCGTNLKLIAAAMQAVGGLQ